MTFVRIREIGKTQEFFSKTFIDQGNIPESLFKEGFGESTEQFAERLVFFGLQDVLLESVQMIREEGRVTNLEKLCDNFLLSYIEEAKYISYSVEPLIAYIAAKDNEIKTVRTIMVGKLTGLPPDQIRERIRDTYA